MGLQDRDYMRRRTEVPRGAREVAYRPRASRRAWLLTAGSVIAVASAAIWLLRDFRFLGPDRAPAEGSLVVNINDATLTQLEAVPGIGPSLAARIMAGRPYTSVDDLLRISGIGERSLEGMRPFLKTDGATQAVER